MSEAKEQEQLQVEVRSTTDGRGMVFFAMKGLICPDHAIELSKLLLDEAVKARADGMRKEAK